MPVERDIESSVDFRHPNAKCLLTAWE